MHFGSILLWAAFRTD